MADPTPIVQTLAIFTERDCQMIVRALKIYAEEYAGTNEMPRLNLLIEKLS